MRGVRRGRGRLYHHFGITVIGRYQHNAASLQHGVPQASETIVDGLDGPDRCGKYSGMTHHVRVRVIHQDKIESAGGDGRDKPVRDLACRHFRLKVVGRDIRRGNQYAFLAIEGVLLSAVKEKSDVCVFFRLCDPQLL